MSRPKLLAIEDNPFDIELLRIALDNQGEEYELEVLQSGEEALQFIRENRTGTRAKEPCLILLDIMLPKHDGMEVLKALTREPALTHIRVVVLSSLVNPEKRAAAERLGAIFRTKPMTLPELFDLGAELMALCKDASPVAVGGPYPS